MSSVGEIGGRTRGRGRLRRVLGVLMGDGLPIVEELMGLHGGEGDAATPLPTEGILLVVLRPTGSVGSGDGGPPPASKASIDAMRTVERVVVAEGGADGVEEEEYCTICLGGLWVEGEEGEEKKKAGRVGVKEMPCGHMFHGGCIESWLGLHGCCPLCRHRMPEEAMGGGRDVGGETWVAFRFPGRIAEGEDDAQQQRQPEQQQQPMEEAK